jgi:hypothetical protein
VYIVSIKSSIMSIILHKAADKIKHRLQIWVHRLQI